MKWRDGHCSRCLLNTEIFLRRSIGSNGAQAVFEVCLLKGEPHRLTKGGQNIPHADVFRRGLRLEDIPILRNDAVVGCSVSGCVEVGFEYHHWAPRSIWREEADLWPTSPLCDIHHKEWHRRTGLALGGPCQPMVRP